MEFKWVMVVLAFTTCGGFILYGFLWLRDLNERVSEELPKLGEQFLNLAKLLGKLSEMTEGIIQREKEANATLGEVVSRIKAGESELELLRNAAAADGTRYANILEDLRGESGLIARMASVEKCLDVMREEAAAFKRKVEVAEMALGVDLDDPESQT